MMIDEDVAIVTVKRYNALGMTKKERESARTLHL